MLRLDCFLLLFCSTAKRIEEKMILDGLFENPQRNIISLKMIYFLDYNSIFSHNS